MTKNLITNNTFRLILLLISFIIVWDISASNNANLIWFIIIGIVSLITIIKRRNTKKQDIIVACVLAGFCIPSNIFMGIFVIPTYLASMCIFKNSKNKIRLYDITKQGSFIITVALIVIIGGLLAGFNVILSLQSQVINPSIKLQWLLDALRAGIFEEVFFRMFFYAICVSLTKDILLTKFQNVLCYAIMIIPHVLIHFNTSTVDLVSIFVLSLFFGLPFAIMQKKYNLVSAMGSHALVDLVRFCIFSM